MTDSLNDNHNRGWFKKGISGNPKGRPKKEAKTTTDITSVLADELREVIQLVEGGKVIHLTKLRALVKSNLLNAIKKGDLKHLKFIVENAQKLGLKRILPETMTIQVIAPDGKGGWQTGDGNGNTIPFDPKKED